MEKKPNKNRWFLVINGIIAILFGLLLLLFTQKIILSVVFFSGLALLVGGLCFLFISIYHLRKDRNDIMQIFQSIFTIAIGLIIMLFQNQSLYMFFILFGIWAIIVGVVHIVILIDFRINLSNKKIILFNGLLTVALGIILIIEREEIPVILTKVMGAFAILFGIVMIYISFIIRQTESLTDDKGN